MVNKVIFITGSNGEMGQSLIETFNKKGYNNIVALDLDQQKSFLNTKFIEGSILDTQLLNDINEKYEISEIYHLAAILSTKAEKDPKLANDVNINGTINLLDLASLQSSKQNKKIPFFFPSSIAVYNVTQSEKTKINEYECCKNPITQYGKAKLECEKKGQQYIDVDFRCIRFPGIISGTSIPSGGTSDFAPEMIHFAAQEIQYNCFVNKEGRVPFIVMPDAIKAVFQIMEVNKNDLHHAAYNITSFSPTVDEFYMKTKQFFPSFNMIYKIDDKRQKIVDSWPDKINDDNARIDWSWNPEFDFEKAYADYLVPEINFQYKLENKNESN